jgi:hypothetical protein
MLLLSFESSCKVVIKDHSIQECQHIASHTMIFCNHLAKMQKVSKMGQKMIGSYAMQPPDALTFLQCGEQKIHFQPEHGIPDFFDAPFWSWHLFVNFNTQIDASVLIFALSTFQDACYSILCSPNEDFRKPKNISDRRFEHFFKGVSIRFGPRLLEKCSKRRSEMFFGFLKSSFGEHKIIRVFSPGAESATFLFATMAPRRPLACSWTE